MRSTYVRPTLKTAIIAGLLLAGPSWAATAAPGGLPFAGYITDATGSAITGSINARFYLSIGGTYTWCAQYTNIPVSSGSFFLVLGQTVGSETGNALSAPTCSSSGGTLAMSASTVSTALSSSNVVIQVTVQPQGGGSYETFGNHFKIGASLFALNSDALGGSAASSYAKFDTSGNLLAQDGTAVISASGAPLGPMIQSSAGTVTNIATGTGLSGGPITSSGTLSLANTAVTAGSYTRANITVDAQGRLTAAASNSTAVPLTSGVSGTLPVANGGTGQTTFTSGNILTGNGTGAISNVATVPVANGGTNSTSTRTAGGIVYGTGTAMPVTAAGTSGYLLTSASAGVPTWSNTPSLSSLTVGGGSSISKVQHGTGSIGSVSCNLNCLENTALSKSQWLTITIPTGDTGWYSTNTRIDFNIHEGVIGSAPVLGSAILTKGDATINASGDLQVRYHCGCYNSSLITVAYDYKLIR